MFPITPRWLLCLIVGCSIGVALATPPPPFVSPEQVAPGEVTFRIYAPDARVVSVIGLRGRPAAPMTKGADGVWSATVGHLPTDIYTYAFDVDGVVTLDNHNRTFKRAIISDSVVEVTGDKPAVYSLLPVPHGTLHRHTYSSGVAGRELSLQVYTPPGYQPGARTRYPLIVLCHGTGDDETTWVEIGRANWIADNLIARGAMKKAIIVMPYGHILPQPLIRPSSYPDANTAEMEKSVLSEVLPFVEANYSVSQRAEDRAIVGLSMGGAHALTIGLSHPEVFRWVGGFSAAVPETDHDTHFAPWLKALRDKQHAPRLLWLGIGRDDALLARNEAFTAWLREHDVPFSWKLTDGGHEWSVWREYFAELAPELFR